MTSAETSDAAPTPRQKLYYYFWAAAGSVFIGVTLPVLLVCWHHSNESGDYGIPTGIHGAHEPSLVPVGVLELGALIFCGPGAVVLAVLLFKFMSRNQNDLTDAHQLVSGSMWRGAVISFFNFPGLAASGMVSGSALVAFIRIVLLFSVAGATCGAWIGWQVYRLLHPQTPFIPRYRLSTLLLMIVAWAALLAIFAPSSKS